MVVDLDRFRPRHELQRGLLWVVEQMPGGWALRKCTCLSLCLVGAAALPGVRFPLPVGLVMATDQTDSLLRSYWPSYNVRP